jgi:3-dehydroquinate dehydratase/shikimate dehydrogenase
MHSPSFNSPTSYLRSRVGRICTAVSAANIRDLFERAEAALVDSHFLELRLDALRTPEEAIPRLTGFLADHRDVTVLATCRRLAYGGSFSGSLADELSILAAAAEAGCALIDLEIESAEQAQPTQLETLREMIAGSGCSLLLSFHDFERPVDAESIFQRIERFRPEFIKIVSTAHRLSDSLSLLRCVERHSSEARIVGIAMGEAGIVSRILSLRAGAAFTFAAAPDGAATAAGQMTARQLKDLYRIEELDQATRIYGVAGNPIGHSLSPLMLNKAFRRERVNAVYLPLRAEGSPSGVEDLLTLIHQLPLSGLSVTMPLKQLILPHLANTDPMTARLGACNTVRLGTDGKLYGFNTDVAGIVRPLEKRLTLKGAQILVLGAGGAARAAIYGLVERGAQVSLWSRKPEAARELASTAGVSAVSEAQIAATEFDVLINATPCGMAGNPQRLPLEGIPWQARLVFDLVYNPLDTPLLQAAEERGIPTIQGYEMFVHQGARQFELWTGKPAPEAEMLRVVLQALKPAV